MKNEIRRDIKGFQYLQNSFFDLCETRKVGKLPMLLYIYLRGLYCRFQKPDFFWSDKTTKKHLRITKPTLISARKYLQERGLITFKNGIGRTPTCYVMLGTCLLPELRGKKSLPLRSRNLPPRGKETLPPIYKSKERVKKRRDIFKGVGKRERNQLIKQGLL